MTYESPIKVLIYSSKELYEKSGYQGRAEAHIIAVRDSETDFFYHIMKNRCGNLYRERISRWELEKLIKTAERDAFNRELELSKKNVVDTRSDQ